MKKPKTDWSKVKWTPFEIAPNQGGAHNLGADAPMVVMVNSIYQVAMYPARFPEPFGVGIHLSIKTHDRQPRHDWRELQRIKNELCGDDCDAIEIYPDEAKLVDAANQYHLFVFRDYKFPFGFQTRLISDGSWRGSLQRPFENRPFDCMDAKQYEAHLDALINNQITCRTCGDLGGLRGCPSCGRERIAFGVQP